MVRYVDQTERGSANLTNGRKNGGHFTKPLRLVGEESTLHSIFAHEVDQLALNADPVRAENARFIGRIGGFQRD